LKVKAVVFDLGKVLVDFDYSIAARKLAENSAKPASEIQKMLDHSPLLYRFESAGMTNEEFYGEFCREAGFSGNYELFAAAFGNIFSEMPEMIRFQQQLRSKRVPTYILSNTNEIAVRHIRRNFPFFAKFDGYILSYEVGALKPHAPIYEAAERMIGARGEDLVFIDDRADNCEGAAKLGWRTICHRDPMATVAVVEELLR
jgi:putative hydrolase of the HAD superfamily